MPELDQLNYKLLSNHSKESSARLNSPNKKFNYIKVTYKTVQEELGYPVNSLANVKSQFS